MKSLKGKLFVISARSGSGKTTLCKRLLEDNLGLAHSISMTTRLPRPGEKGSVDYYFVSRRYFCQMIKKRAFLEYEDNFGYFYGTPKRFIKDKLKEDAPVLLSIDVKGAMKIKKIYPKNSILIFILPPSIDSLRKRLSQRMSEGQSSISKRLGIARREMAYKDRYDYRIVNDQLERAYRKLKKIIVSEMNNQKEGIWRMYR